MKASIESLRERLDDMFFKDTTPTSVRSTVSDKNSNAQCRVDDIVPRSHRSKETDKVGKKSSSNSLRADKARRSAKTKQKHSEYQTNDASLSSSPDRDAASRKSVNAIEKSLLSKKGKTDFVKQSNTGFKELHVGPIIQPLHDSDIACFNSKIKDERKLENKKQAQIYNSSMGSKHITNRSDKLGKTSKFNESLGISTFFNSPVHIVPEKSSVFIPAVRSDTLRNLPSYTSNPSSKITHNPELLTNTHEYSSVIPNFCPQTRETNFVKTRSKSKDELNGGVIIDSKLQAFCRPEHNLDTFDLNAVESENIEGGNLLVRSSSKGKSDFVDTKHSVMPTCFECGAFCVCGKTIVSSVKHASALESEGPYNFKEKNGPETNNTSELYNNDLLSRTGMGSNGKSSHLEDLERASKPSKHSVISQSFYTSSSKQKSTGKFNTSLPANLHGGIHNFLNNTPIEIASFQCENSEVLDSGISNALLEHSFTSECSQSSVLDQLTNPYTEDHISSVEFDHLLRSESLLPEKVNYEMVDDCEDVDSVITISSMKTDDTCDVESLNDSRHHYAHEDKVPEVTRHTPYLDVGEKQQGVVSLKRVRFNLASM